MNKKLSDSGNFPWVLIIILLILCGRASYFTGTEQFASMRDLYIRNGEGFVIVYGINSYQSFKDVMLMKDAICRIKRKKTVPIILVGNKCDLQFEREVTQADGQQLADIWNVPFLETSAKKRHNINELFMEAVAAISNANKKRHDCCTLL